MENAADAFRHGSVARGERHGVSKLTADQVLDIYRSPEGAEVVARRFGVSPANVRSIRRGNTWSQVTGHPRPRVPLAAQLAAATCPGGPRDHLVLTITEVPA